MADRFPLILNTSANQIQEIASGDQLDLSGVNIANTGIITASTFKGDGDFVELDVDGHTNLDNVSIAGVSTFTGNIDANGSLDVDGHTELDNVNISGVTTFNSNVHLLDNDYARFGSSQDLSIFHDGTNNWFWSGGGHPTIHESSGSWTLRSVANQNYIIATENNSVDLYYSGNKKLNTTSSGAEITGNLVASGNITANNGTVTVSGSAPKITFTETNDNPDYKLEANGGNIAFVDTTNSATRLSISSSGINVTGNGVFSGNVSVGGVLTYEDVTNVDSVGIVTARKGVRVNVDGTASANYISVGAGNDLKIWHQSSNNHSYISETGSGSLIVLADDFYVQDTSTNTMISAIEGDAVNLHFNGNLKLSTHNTGANVTSANDAVLQVTTTGSAATDDARIELITQESSFIIQNDRSLGTDGGLTIGDGTKTYFQVNKDGAVEISYNGTKVIETKGYGLDITGGFIQTGSSIVNDNGQFKLGTGGDLKLFHDGNNSMIQNDTGILRIIGQTGQKIDLCDDNYTTYYMRCNSGGSIDLYYANNKKLETRNNGITVTGSIITSSYGQLGYYSGLFGKIRVGADVYGNTIKVANDNNMNLIANNSVAFALGANANGSDSGTTVALFTIDGLRPATNNARDLGSTTFRWRNIYTNDLNLSNEGGANDVDGTWGNYMIQEGENDLFLINKRNGKKYKFNLTEVS